MNNKISPAEFQNIKNRYNDWQINKMDNGVGINTKQTSHEIVNVVNQIRALLLEGGGRRFMQLLVQHNLPIGPIG